MSIEFACGSCGQRYQVKDEFAGKTTRCRKCGESVTVPTPEPVAVEADDIDALLGDIPARSTPTLPSTSATVACAACQAPLPAGESVCGECGFDPSAKIKRPAELAAPAVPQREKPAKSASGSGAGILRGTLISGGGALLGAIVWAIVAVLTQHEIGWIAWGIGVAAGAGMAYGRDDAGDGTLRGIVAACLALGGIVLGKLLIVAWVVYPIISGSAITPELQRQVLAVHIANSTVEARGPNAANDEQVMARELNVATERVRLMSDAEVKSQFDEVMKSIPDDEVEVDGENLTLGGWIGLFFSTMFGPMDALFVLLAVASAYKVGSGGSEE